MFYLLLSAPLTPHPHYLVLGRRLPTTAHAKGEGGAQAVPVARRQLDLREGATVRLVAGPHTGDEGVVTSKNREGHWRLRFMHQLKKGSKLKRPFERVLGTWWVEAAVQGKVFTTRCSTVLVRRYATPHTVWWCCPHSNGACWFIYLTHTTIPTRILLNTHT